MNGIQDFSFKEKKVLIRVDFNTPFDKNGFITDDRRIRNSLPTIQKITSDGGIAILLAHLGRPKNGYEAKYSLSKIRIQLANLLQQPVLFSSTCVGAEVKQMISNLKPGNILLLENIRFFSEETTNDPNFAQELASLADVYVNDAFGVIHRNHLSISLLPQYLKKRFAGYLMQQEIQAIDKLFAAEPSSTIAIIGGSKLIDKIKPIVRLTQYTNHILVGGGLVLPLYRNKQGGSDISAEMDPGLVEAIALGKICLPTDVVCSDDMDENTPTSLMNLSDVSDNQYIIDIGTNTQAYFSKLILQAKMIVWVGPVGIYEWNQASSGTAAITYAISKATKNGAYSIVGGGDTAAAITQLEHENKFSHISTGGGALLAYIAENGKLPGLIALK